MLIEARERDKSQVQGQQRSQQVDDVGVIIVTKRARGGIPGPIKNPPCCIWIQQMMRRRGAGTRGGGGGRRIRGGVG